MIADNGEWSGADILEVMGIPESDGATKAIEHACQTMALLFNWAEVQEEARLDLNGYTREEMYAIECIIECFDDLYDCNWTKHFIVPGERVYFYQSWVYTIKVRRKE